MKVKISMNDNVCPECGKSYEEWGDINYCSSCRACNFSMKRKDFLKIRKLIKKTNNKIK